MEKTGEIKKIVFISHSAGSGKTNATSELMKRTVKNKDHQNDRSLSPADLATIENFERLWQERATELGISKKTLTEEAGYSRGFVYRVLNRQRQMPDHMVKVAARLLQVPEYKIKPVSAGVTLGNIETTSNVPVFNNFVELLRFKQGGEIPEDIEFMPSYAVQKRYLALRDSYGEVDSIEQANDFRHKLGFCAMILKRNVWFAKKGDYLVIDLLEKPLDDDRITVWTWDRESFVMGYVENYGASKALRVPESRMEVQPLQDAEYVGYVRAVQFE